MNHCQTVSLGGSLRRKSITGLVPGVVRKSVWEDPLVREGPTGNSTIYNESIWERPSKKGGKTVPISKKKNNNGIERRTR